MKYNKQNIIELLEIMESTTYEVAKIHEETYGKDEFYKTQMAEMCGLMDAISILKSKKVFDTKAKIYFPENN